MEKEVNFEDIKQEALTWLNNNKCRSCKGNGNYGSPRISSEFPDCSTPFSFDMYNFCSYGCLYCFSYFQKLNNPSLQSEDSLKLKSVNVKHFIDLFEGKYPENVYYKHFIKNKKVMHIGGMADNFCNFERFNKEGIQIIEYLLRTGYPIIISSKGTVYNFPEYAELFEKYKDVANCAFQASIITADDVLASQVEIGTPTPTQRFENLKWLKDLGYYTILRLRPFMIGISNKTLTQMLQSMIDYKIDAISTEFYAMDLRVGEEVKNRYKWMSQLVGFDYIEYYRKLSPSNRGTYRRLNRNVKEKYIKQIYKFCVDNNKIFACSDPDFKELNMTGSCCGLPKLDGQGIGNYCHNQLTQALSNLRIKYWKSKGKDKFLYLKDLIVDKVEHEWWNQVGMFDSDCICGISMNGSERHMMTYWIQFKKDWNNIRSPKNLFNYFNGKLIPTNLKDEEGNIVFEYNPSSYELVWIEEGIL